MGMKCHYEVLGIAKDAQDDDIKKSYRKLALKHHPDKNPENIEECTRVFHTIQQAYEVLIDPQERAWYDKHREAILRGGLGKGGEYEDTSLDVYQYFNTACFSGYGNDEGGFYQVYQEVFQTIAKEDLEFMDADEDSDVEYPEFGDSTSSYDKVVGPFYAFWESYCTAKSYVWAEKYDTREAPNRQIRRLMEQDNKKLRDKAKKERNEEVRALVAFVRKRDRRVQAQKKLLEERAAEIAKRADERKKKDRAQRLKTMAGYKETEWSAMGALEKDLEQLEANYAQQFGDDAQDVSEEDAEEEGVEEEFFDELFCVACNKDFKSDRAFENHEKSKKHRENVAFLKAQMAAEEEGFDSSEGRQEDGTAAEGGISAAGTAQGNEESGIGKTKLSKKQKKKRKQQQKLKDLSKESGTQDSRTQDVEGRDMTEIEEDSVSDRLARVHISPSETEAINGDIMDTETTDLLESKESEVVADSTDLPAVTLTTEPPGARLENQCDEATDTTLNSNEEQTEQKQNTKKSENKPSMTHEKCNKCGATFPSRNKLFQHVKETGHALRVEGPPPDPQPAPGAKGKRKKKGKR